MRSSAERSGARAPEGVPGRRGASVAQAALREVRGAATEVRRRLARLPIRVKLTLAFAGVMVVLLGGLALLLYTRFQAGLDAGIQRSLQAQAADLAVLARASGPLLATRPALAESEGTFAEILDANGRVLASSPGAQRRPLLSASEVARASRGPLALQRSDQSRLLARPVLDAAQERVVAVVGVSLGQREHALNTLGDLLFIGGPLALVLACGAGYALAAGALAPVESMRRRAAEISGGDPDAQLPVPDADDEVHRLGETLNEMLSRLASAVTRERSLVAHASHELRTPLSILKLELELALAAGRSREELEAALGSAAEEVDRLTRLAEDLLVIARADQGRLPLRKERIDAQDLMRTIAARFDRLGRAEGRAVVVAGTQAVEVDVDAARIEQALANLVDNALRYGAGSVELRAAKSNGTVELHVFDQGAGFPPAFMPEALERFSRHDGSRSRAGTGLGLSIVRAIAQAHGGDVGVENRSGGGAHVWLTLPPAPARAAGANRGELAGEAAV